MNKRSKGKFPRRELDQYDTPETAVYPLFPYLPLGGEFLHDMPELANADFNVWEPCAGSGALALVLMQHPHCQFVRTSDIEPRSQYIAQRDAFDMSTCGNDIIVTNPPWERDILHRMISHFRHMAPTWLLIDANWAHTKQASEHLKYCAKIVTIGRVSWMKNKVSGFDDSCWYLFRNDRCDTIFHGRN